jgi:hypothetical protein
MEWRSVVGTVKAGTKLYLQYDSDDGGGGGGGGGGDRNSYDLVHENRVTTEFDLVPTRVSNATCLSCYTPN